MNKNLKENLITKSKIGYVFFPVTGEYVSEEIVYVEKKTGLFPCAKNVVFVKPPEVGKNQKQVWTGKDWKIVPDYRGIKFYDENGNPCGFITELGDIGDKIIKEPPRYNSPEYLRYNRQKRDWDVLLDDNYIKDGELIRYKTQEELYKEGRITLNEYNEYIREQRELRFAAETDKMGLMYLRGECTLDEWQAAMDKIREELPKK